MDKWLAKIGMWFHKHKNIYEISVNKERAIFECGECGNVWSWDRYLLTGNKMETNSDKEIKRQVLEWLNASPRSNAEIAQKICDSINITYDLVKKKNVNNEMRLELFKALVR